MLTARSWPDLLGGAGRTALAGALREFVQRQRWYGAKARTLRAAAIAERIPLPGAPVPAALAFLAVSYADGTEEQYLLAPTFLRGPLSEHPPVEPRAAIAEGRLDDLGPGTVVDGLAHPALGRWIVRAIAAGERLAGEAGELVASATTAFQGLRDTRRRALPEPVPLGSEQSNTSLRFGTEAILKVFRRLQPGINPDLEMGRFLTERGFAHTPPVLGALEYVAAGEPFTLAVLSGFVPNRGDGWQYTLEALRAPLGSLASARPPRASTALAAGELLDLVGRAPPRELHEPFAAHLAWARVLGDRTAALHLALASGVDDPAFAPEPFGPQDAQDLSARTGALLRSVLGLLRSRVEQLPPDVAGAAQQVLGREPALRRILGDGAGASTSALRLRVHGDYHLGQVLVRDGDVAIIDFEGEPARPIAERRRKDLAVRDVAGMIRSFHYAASSVLRGPADAPLRPWARAWYRWTAAAFLGGYLRRAGRGTFLPHARRALATLLDAYLLDKAVYELGYELNNRPEWVDIPLGGILEIAGG